MNNLMFTYAKFPVRFIRGEGSSLYDENQKKYIDFTSGIGVNSLGHNYPKWVEAITNQAKTLAHTSNLYYNNPSELLASKLVEISGLNNVFLSNSGAEANEALIKIVRKYNPNKPKIITLKQSFHGRTIATLEATGQDKFHENFKPFTNGFYYIEKENLDIFESEKFEDVGAIFIELIQGEGGVYPLDKEYVLELERICKQKNWLLCIDEVQTGIARTGSWFAYQQYDILPDLVSFAKGIGAGLPIGGVISGEKCKDVFQNGDHGSTFGGNLVCCQAALTVLETLEFELENIKRKGEKLKNVLIDIFGNARGLGMMLGASVTTHKPIDYANDYLEKGLAILTAGSDAIRLLPPLNIKDNELDEGIKILYNKKV